MNLKNKLNNLVERFDLENGVVDKLVDQAYKNIEEDLMKEATKGQRYAVVEILFSGCRGGYENHKEKVTVGVLERLRKEDVAAGWHNISPPDGGTYIRVEW